jgi:hypothetical protein
MFGVNFLICTYRLFVPRNGGKVFGLRLGRVGGLESFLEVQKLAPFTVSAVAIVFEVGADLGFVVVVDCVSVS